MTDRNRRPLTASADALVLGKLLEGIASIDPVFNRKIGALQLNSQLVESGDVFIALPGMTADGRDYIDSAVQKDASVVLFEKQASTRSDGMVRDTLLVGVNNLKHKLGYIASRYHTNPSRALNVIGLTGTNGKTTTAYLVAQALSFCDIPCAYSGTIGSGWVENLKPVELTTADSITLQSQLAEFVSQNAKALTIEVSSHGLDQGRANAVEFQTAVFTNLTQDHLDYHQTMEAYAKAKQRLFEFDSLQSVVINSDDSFGRVLIEVCEKRQLKCIRYGLQSGDLRAGNIVLSDRGMKFDVDEGGHSVAVSASMIGRVNVYNLLATIGVLRANNIDMNAIAALLPQLKAPPGRMELYRYSQAQPGVVVDFAHTPDALERALKSLRELCRGKLIVVFGCGGDRDQAKRPQMGAAAETYADEVIVTDDNPRTEPADEIVSQILEGMNKEVIVLHDRRQAIRHAINMATVDDLILVAGKGHEQTQSIGAQRFAMSDRIMVPEILAELAL